MKKCAPALREKGELLQNYAPLCTEGGESFAVISAPRACGRAERHDGRVGFGFPDPGDG